MYRWLIYIIFYLTPFQGFAQYGSISGIITDETNQPIRDVKVVVVNSPINTLSDSNGFMLEGLQPGFVDVKIAEEGYITAMYTNVPVKADSIIKLNVKLQPNLHVNPIRKEYNVANTVHFADSVTFCRIVGTITNGKKPINAKVKIYKEGVLIQEMVTDIQGNYSISLKEGGEYTLDVTSKYKGPHRSAHYYPNVIYSGVILKPGYSANISFKMPLNNWLEVIEVTAY